jgi:diaminopimelate epimerase
MAVLNFYKYQGCGNDFILLDRRNEYLPIQSNQIVALCDRRFGIGADGLMELINSNSHDFTMRYYNSDGNESSFCGNGGRCIAQFAKDLGIVSGDSTNFLFKDLPYSAVFLSNGTISLQMKDVAEIATKENDLFFDTGSPHYIRFRSDIEAMDLIHFAHQIRYSEDFPAGINVNAVEVINEYTIKMRTYERGVENETYSCGTGVTAAAIAFHFSNLTQRNQINIETKGGNFQVEFKEINGMYSDVKLIGPAIKVFEGRIDL